MRPSDHDLADRGGRLLAVHDQPAVAIERGEQVIRMRRSVPFTEAPSRSCSFLSNSASDIESTTQLVISRPVSLLMPTGTEASRNFSLNPASSSFCLTSFMRAGAGSSSLVTTITWSTLAWIEV